MLNIKNEEEQINNALYLLKEYLTTNITPIKLNEEIDEIIFFIIMLVGDVQECHFSNRELNKHIYYLKQLRDLFGNAAKHDQSRTTGIE